MVVSGSLVFQRPGFLVLQRYSQTGHRMSSKEATHHLKTAQLLHSFDSFVFSFIRSSYQKNTSNTHRKHLRCFVCVLLVGTTSTNLKIFVDTLKQLPTGWAALLHSVALSMQACRKKSEGEELFLVSRSVGQKNGNPILPVYTKSSLGIHHSREDWASITRDLFSAHNARHI